MHDENNAPESPGKPCGPNCPLTPWGPGIPCRPWGPLSPGNVGGSGRGPWLPGNPRKPEAQEDQTITIWKITKNKIWWLMSGKSLLKFIIYPEVHYFLLDQMGLFLPSHPSHLEHPSIPVLLSLLQEKPKLVKAIKFVIMLWSSMGLQTGSFQWFSRTSF